MPWSSLDPITPANLPTLGDELAEMSGDGFVDFPWMVADLPAPNAPPVYGLVRARICFNPGSHTFAHEFETRSVSAPCFVAKNSPMWVKVVR